MHRWPRVAIETPVRCPEPCPCARGAPPGPRAPASPSPRPPRHGNHRGGTGTAVRQRNDPAAQGGMPRPARPWPRVGTVIGCMAAPTHVRGAVPAAGKRRAPIMAMAAKPFRITNRVTVSREALYQCFSLSLPIGRSAAGGCAGHWMCSGAGAIPQFERAFYSARHGGTLRGWIGASVAPAIVPRPAARRSGSRVGKWPVNPCW